MCPFWWQLWGEECVNLKTNKILFPRKSDVRRQKSQILVDKSKKLKILSSHMWLVSQGNPYVMQETCQCTFLKGFSITNNILAKKKFFIFANFFKWRFLFYLVKTKDPGLLYFFYVKKKISPILMKLEIRNP